MFSSLGLMALLISLPTLWQVHRLSRGHNDASLASLIMALAFVLGYLGFLWVLNHNLPAQIKIVVAAIFGAGGVFVLVVSWLSYQTMQQLLKMLHIKQHQAEHDPLTGLANRHGFYTRLDNLIEKKTPLVCAMLDLNDFKKINDTYGHHVGDALLMAIAKLITRISPDAELCARLGGDEFAIVMPGCNLSQAYEMAKKIHASLKDELHIEQHRITTGCSIGLSQYPQQASERQQLLKAADIAMYQAKKHRTGICIFGAASEISGSN